MDSRCPIDETKDFVIFLLITVHVKTVKDFILEILVDVTRVIHDLQLAHSRDSEKHVLIVDERLVAIVKRLVVVPFSPVEAIHQWSFGILMSWKGKAYCMRNGALFEVVL